MPAEGLDLPFSAYAGAEPFAFVCYAHADAEEVYAELCWLHDSGVNIWYDEGISPGRRWRDEIADAIDRCALFIAFISPDLVASPHCHKEINYAIARNKNFLGVYLRDTDLTPGLLLATGDLQAVFKHRIPRIDFEHRVLGYTSAALGLAPEAPVACAHQPAHAAPAGTQERTGWRSRAAVWSASAVAAGAVAALVVLLASNPFREPPTDRTIAVLPFENFTGSPDNDYLSDGIAEEIIDLLEKVDDLRVVGRRASFYFKGKDVDFGTIANQLGADVILEGSLRRDEDRLRVAAQLIDGRTGLHVWSKIFEEEIGNSFVVQQAIAMQVAEELRARLSNAEIAALTEPPTRDPVAYSYYLEGRNYLRVASHQADLDTARNLFTRALERDDGFLPALAGLCETELVTYQRSLSVDDHSRATSVCSRLVVADDHNVPALVALGTLNRLSGNHREALRLFDAALAIRPAHEPAHYGRARALQGLGDLEAAERSMRRSIELDPGFWQVYFGYGVFLAQTGRPEEAAQQFREIVRLTPDNPIGYANLGTALFATGEWEEAEEAWRTSLELDETAQGYINLGTTLYYQWKYAEAAAIFARGTEKFPETYRLWGKLGAALAEAGRESEAEQAFRRGISLAESLLQINSSDPEVMSYLGVYYARVDEFDRALELCARASRLAPRDPDVQYLLATARRLAGDEGGSQAALSAARELGYSPRLLDHDPVFKRG